MNKKIVQIAGREVLGEFAPSFAHLNDDILFGEVWNEEAIDTKLKCIITVVSLMASGITDSSLQYHLENAKKNAEIILCGSKIVLSTSAVVKNITRSFNGRF